MPPETRVPASDTYGWDWTATTHDVANGTPLEVVDVLLKALGGTRFVRGKGLQGWSQSVDAFDVLGYKLGSVYFGGGREDVHVLSTSDAAHRARTSVAQLAEGKTSRVDTRVDTLVPFEVLRGLLEGVAGPQTKVTYMESRVGTESTGRTLYVGAPTSAVRVRLYEKWLQSPGQYVEGTNRVEVQLRPPSRAKREVSSWTPAETFCASKLTRRLAAELGTDVAKPGTLQKKLGTPDLERSLQAMGDQYGPAVGRWLELSGGDVDAVLEHLQRDREVPSAPQVEHTPRHAGEPDLTPYRDTWCRCGCGEFADAHTGGADPELDRWLEGLRRQGLYV